MLRQNRQHIALLRLIAPDFTWRQAGFFQLDFRQIKNRTFFRAVNNLREGIRNTARADIVDRQNRVVRAELPAAVDDLLRTALDFRVAALHRIKIELRAVRTRVHRRGRATAETDFHARAAELNQQCTFGQIALANVLRINIAHTACDHDGLVIAVDLIADLLLKCAEIAGQIRAAEFIVKRRAANRPSQHDLQRTGGVLRLAIFLLPRTRCVGQMQMGHGKAGQAGFWLTALSGRALVANFPARTRRRSGERFNRGRVIVCFHLHQGMGQRGIAAVHTVRVGVKTFHHRALHHRRIVVIRHHVALRVQLVRVANHFEQAHRLLLAINDEVRVKNFVAAMLRVRLREHHQFHIGRVALNFLVRIDQIIHFILGQRQAQFNIGLSQRRFTIFQQRNRLQRLIRQFEEQLMPVILAREPRLRHAIVHALRHRRQLICAQGFFAAEQTLAQYQAILNPTLDATNVRQTRVVRNVRGFTRPRRNRADARHHGQAHLVKCVALVRFTIRQQTVQNGQIRLGQRRIRPHIVDKA